MKKWILTFLCFILIAQISNAYSQSENEIGTWTVVPSSKLIIKEIEGKKWLLQTNPERSYYVIRGKNFLSDNNVILEKIVNPNDLANEVTALGGLFPAISGKTPLHWPGTWWSSRGYVQNEEGEFVKSFEPETSINGSEQMIGSWSVVPDSVLILKTIENRKWLLQTNKSKAYYVVRGRNMLDRPDITISANFDPNEISNEVTGAGGLMPASNNDSRYPALFPVSWWAAQGYEQNDHGEWVSVSQDKIVGTWRVVPDSLLIIKTIEGKRWLLQTNTTKDYYVVRGKNFLNSHDVVLTMPVNQDELENEVTALGGLMPSVSGSYPIHFPVHWWHNNQYFQNDQGEWVYQSSGSTSGETAGGSTSGETTGGSTSGETSGGSTSGETSGGSTSGETSGGSTSGETAGGTTSGAGQNGIEFEVGSWNVVPNSVLIIKEIDGKKWLLQTSPDRAYYVIRGKNFLSRSDISLSGSIDPNLLANEITENGGLLPGANGSLPLYWPHHFWSSEGFTQNENGEFVKGEQGTTTGSSGGSDEGNSSSTKITIPVGAIRWDAWGESIFNINDPDTHGDITQFTRAALGNDQFRHLIPFFGKITETQIMNLVYQQTPNPPSPFYTMPTFVEFNGNKQSVMDKEIEYAKNSGIDYFLFCYYPDNTSLAYARKLFISSQKKLGLKMAYRLESLGGVLDFEFTKTINPNELSNEVTPLNGLYPAKTGRFPAGWPVSWWEENGYSLNNEGEYFKNGGHDTSNEIEIGTWKIAQGSVIIIKTINGKKWLMQTNKNRDYYVIRGRNFIEGSLRAEESIQHMAWAMKQNFYQRIGGKPVIYVVPGSEFALPRLKQLYGGEVYSLFMPIKAYPQGDIHEIYKHNMNGGSWYGSWVNSDLRKHSYVMQEDINIREDFVRYGSKDIAPVLTISFSNEPIVYTKDNSDRNKFVEPATDAENEQQLIDMRRFANAHPDRVKTIVLYSWNENAESGKPIVPTLNRDGSINTNVVDLLRKHLD